MEIVNDRTAAQIEQVLAQPAVASRGSSGWMCTLRPWALVVQRSRSGQRALVGAAWVDNDLVFTTATGKPMRGNHILERNFAPILRRVGLPPMRFHDLRHTAATLLLMQGVHPKIVSEMLGYSTINMTLDTYSHILPDMQRDATEAIDRLLGQE